MNKMVQIQCTGMEIYSRYRLQYCNIIGRETSKGQLCFCGAIFHFPKPVSSIFCLWLNIGKASHILPQNVLAEPLFIMILLDIFSRW